MNQLPPGEPNWDSRTNFNFDCVVDVVDLLDLVEHFGESDQSTELVLQMDLNGYAGTRDGYMSAASTGANHNQVANMRVCGFADQGASQIRHSLVKLDLAGAVAPGTAISSAKVCLYSYNPATIVGTDGFYGLYPLTQDWTSRAVTWLLVVGLHGDKVRGIGGQTLQDIGLAGPGGRRGRFADDLGGAGPVRLVNGAGGIPEVVSAGRARTSVLTRGRPGDRDRARGQVAGGQVGDRCRGRSVAAAAAGRIVDEQDRLVGGTTFAQVKVPVAMVQGPAVVGPAVGAGMCDGLTSKLYASCTSMRALPDMQIDWPTARRHRAGRGD